MVWVRMDEDLLGLNEKEGWNRGEEECRLTGEGRRRRSFGRFLVQVPSDVFG